MGEIVVREFLVAFSSISKGMFLNMRLGSSVNWLLLRSNTETWSKQFPSNYGKPPVVPFGVTLLSCMLKLDYCHTAAIDSETCCCWEGD